MTPLRTRLALSFCVVLVAANVLLVVLVSSPTPGLLRVSFLNIGQGDAILIQSPVGRTVLIDGGPDRSVLRELSGVLGPLERDIDVVIATHPDKDHIAGLPDVFAQYHVHTLLTSGRAGDTDIYDAFVQKVAEEKGLSAYLAHAGQRIDLGGGAYLEVLYPDRDVSHIHETNDASVVVRLVYGQSTVMLTGDAPATIEEELVKALPAEALQSDILKAGHHGSKYSSSAPWLASVSPAAVVISAGQGNSYGHPAPEVLERIAAAGSQVFSTIEEGTITFESDGVSLWKRP